LSGDARKILAMQLEGLAFFESLDVNKDGKISMPEAKKALVKLFPALEKSINKAFVDADSSADFYLDQNELIALRASLAEYAKVDTSGDGQISMPEAKKALVGAYPQLDKQINTAFVDADVDVAGDFYLNMREFTSLHAALRAYAKIDASGDGKISMPEAKKAMLSLYPQLDKSINIAFVDADKSGDFYLSMREYAALHGSLSAFAKAAGADGKISMPEAKKVLMKVYPELDKQINTAFVDADDSGDFYLDMREFASLHSALETYAAVDTSGDGKLSMPEAKKALVKSYPVMKAVINSAFVAADDSGDGDFYLSMREFSYLKRMLGGFVKADKSADGKLSLGEAKKVLGRDFPKADVAKVFLEVDKSSTSGDFYLSPKEYLELYKKVAA